MPGLVRHTDAQAPARKKRKHAAQSDSAASEVAKLEASIQDSQRNLNNIARLLTLTQEEVETSSRHVPATIALCRVFVRLIAEERLLKTKQSTDNERTLVDWLKARFNQYKDCLAELLSSSSQAKQELSLKLGMQLIKAELDANQNNTDSVWRTGLFHTIVGCLISDTTSDETREAFVTQFAEPFDDVRHHLFRNLSDLISHASKPAQASVILLFLEAPQQDGKSFKNLYCSASDPKKSPVSFSAHRKAAQQAWLAVLSSGLTTAQRKMILNKMTDRVVPWFQSTEMLMDFLTDSFDVGGATSLLALSGLFHLIQEHNLDYPDFYLKLYAMLDADLLHSKHRSRFFRLMDTFLSSTHLPAALVASFIKRLSRLALHSPPAAVVAVIPWIYNMFKVHPTTTFMMHRLPETPEEQEHIDQMGAEDPFDMDETDPMATGAIESCVWELVSLQNHYHPNVASLAKIISQQFTKSTYNLEDFLDHSYSSLIDAELGKPLKKSPVTNWQIPKTVFREEGEGADRRLEEMMRTILNE